MKIAIVLILFILFWAALYLCFRNRKLSFSERLSEYTKWMKKTLDDMFYRLSEKNARRLVIVLMFTAGAFGFLLPGRFSEMDKLASIERAIDLNKKGNYKEVVVILEDLKGIDSPIVHNELGIAYLGTGQYDWAEKEFQKAIKILPDYSKSHYNLAGVYTSLGRDSDAFIELSKAEETSKYTVSEEDVYRLSGGILDNIFLRLMLLILMAYLGYKIPWAAIKFLKRRRITKFDAQLADGLVMISNGLRAGFSLVQALELTSKEARPPLSQEFELMLKEHRLGYDLDEALRRLSERMPTTDTKMFVNSTLILRETGGNLTEIFDTISQTMQERKRVKSKIKTMTAEGETQAVILAILPIALAFILDKMDPDMFTLMHTTTLGWILIILMAFMEAVGLLWMLKIVRVKI